MFFRISSFHFITCDSDTSLEYPTTCHGTLTVDIVAAGVCVPGTQKRVFIGVTQDSADLDENVNYNVIYNTFHQGLPRRLGMTAR